MGSIVFVIKYYISQYVNIQHLNHKKRNATKPGFSTIQPSIDVTGIRNERWQ